jgi:hypothetical protein
MLDYLSIVDDLRSCVLGSDLTLNDSMRQLAADYEAACREANARLRRCEDFLQKGLRSEAVQLAEAEPPLLDVVAALDFPERDQWEVVAATYGLPRPPRLQLETAAALNRAYAEEQPLEELLRQHRRLALMRAPLCDRLAALRLVASADRGNPVWSTDLADLEKARLRQIDEGAEQAAGRRDAAAVVALQHELLQTPWTEPPSRALVLRVTASAEAMWRQYALERLDELSGHLQEAFGRRDEGRARAIREEWKGLAEQAGITPGDPIYTAVAAAFRWLARRDRQLATQQAFQAASAELEQALDQNVNVEELERLYYALRRFKLAPPATLVERYKERVDTLDRSTNRREWVIISITFVVGLIALLSFLTFMLVRHHH